MAVAIVSTVVAVLALVAAGVSAKAARDSADEAKRGNQLAEEANTRADRAEKRATARNDVYLETQLFEEDLVLWNWGLDPALETTVVLFMHRSRQTLHYEVGEVTYHAGRLVSKMSTDFDIAEREALAYNQELKRLRQLGRNTPEPIDPAVMFTERFVWRDESGMWNRTEPVERRITRPDH